MSLTHRRWTPGGRPLPRPASLRAGLLLDRDGTLTHERGHLDDPDQLEPIPGSVAAVRRAHAAGLGMAVLTNQSAVGRGIVSEARLAELHARIAELFDGIEAVYHCPHLPSDDCRCRKPAPVMVTAACADLGLDASRTAFVGDHLSDCLAARAAGCSGILVLTGHGSHHADEARAAGFPVVPDLAAAVDLHLQNGSSDA